MIDLKIMMETLVPIAMDVLSSDTFETVMAKLSNNTKIPLNRLDITMTVGMKELKVIPNPDYQDKKMVKEP